MDHRLKTTLFFLLVLVSISSLAQSTAVDYLTAINAEYAKISKEQWDYSRAVGHGKRARLVEKRRTDLLQTIQESKKTISKMKPFNNNKSLRDSIVLYLDLSYKLINQDYAKIVNMEEVAEQSYDAMEAYMLAKEMASAKELKASEMASHQIEHFAAENNIKLIDQETKLGKKMEAAGKTFDYYNKIYLIFFKAYKEDMYLAEALRNTDVNSIEQNRNSLANYSTTGIEKMKEYTRFQNDETLSAACRQVLAFYKDEAENKTPLLLDYLTAKDKFEKIKTTFDNIKPDKRTNQNITTYNDAIKEMNAASANYNDINKKLNESAKKVLDNWNKKSDTFLDTHIP